MVWEIVKKDFRIKKCFALFPKRIGDYRVWLSCYYKTWDYQLGLLTAYSPRYFIHKAEAEAYVENKKREGYKTNVWVL